MARLITLPAELLHNIFRLLDPEDLGLLPRVCTVLHDEVHGNWKLHKDVYLNHLDKPSEETLDWIKEIQDVVRLRAICQRANVEDKESELDLVYNVANRLLKNASSAGHVTYNSKVHCASRNADFLKSLFADESNRKAFLEKSFVFERVRKGNSLKFPETLQKHHQQSAKLHCLYGKPILEIGKVRSKDTYPYARSKIYDLREFTAESMWGPWKGDGSGDVDWEKVEAVMIAIGFNIHSKRFIKSIFSDVWDSPFSGSWPNSCMVVPAPDTSSLEARDPYGVTGTWFRIVCFLDFRDFLDFNELHQPMLPLDTPRPPISSRIDEATRLIVVQIHITKIEPPGPGDHPDFPVVHFLGVSRTIDESYDENGNTGIRGQVRTTKEGEVRWTTVSIFGGEERWRSEGVQIGGPRSGRGVFGTWFDNGYDIHGPAGPTAFWKASDSEQLSSRLQDILPNGFLAYSALIEIDPDPEGDMDYRTDDDPEDEDEDPLELEALEDELPALLQEAEMEFVPQPTQENGEGT